MGDYHRLQLGMLFIDVLVKGHRPGGNLSRLPLSIPDEDQVLRLEVGPVLVVGGDDEGAVVQLGGVGALPAGEQLVVVAPLEIGAHVPPQASSLEERGPGVNSSRETLDFCL